MDELIELFNTRRAIVGVIGLGYVGLPLASTIAEAGFAAIGFDTKTSKIEALRRRESYIHHVPAARLEKLVRTDAPAAGRAGLHASADFADLARCDAILICVPTPLTEDREPDLSYVVDTAEADRAAPARAASSSSWRARPTRARPARSSCPSWSAAACGPAATSSSPSAPSARTPATPTSPPRTIPKVVGGLDARSAATWPRRSTARSSIEVVPVSSAEVAEACKILENTYRAVNIALVNELKVALRPHGHRRLGGDRRRGRPSRSASRPFYPGPGLGGHCIPIDPFYLTWVARQYGLTTRFIELAGEINTAMPAYVVERSADALNERGKPSRGPHPRPRRGLQEGRGRRPRVAGLRADGPAGPQGRRRSPTTTRTSPRCRLAPLRLPARSAPLTPRPSPPRMPS